MHRRLSFGPTSGPERLLLERPWAPTPSPLDTEPACSLCLSGPGRHPDTRSRHRPEQRRRFDTGSRSKHVVSVSVHGPARAREASLPCPYLFMVLHGLEKQACRVRIFSWSIRGSRTTPVTPRNGPGEAALRRQCSGLQLTPAPLSTESALDLDAPLFRP